MRHLYWTLLALPLLCMPIFGQSNPHTILHGALVLNNRGEFETAARFAKAAIDSRQLDGNELGRGYIILAVACQGAGDLANARIAFEHALQILAHDPSTPRTMLRPWKTTPNSTASWDNLTWLRRCG
jgi:hypothetical protein